MKFSPVGWTHGPRAYQCLSQSFYSGGVLAECELDPGHKGRHQGRDRWGFLCSWDAA